MRGVDCCCLLTGVRDVCCWIPVPSLVSDLHVSLGTAEQEGSSFMERETEQHESASLRNFQERSFRTLSERSAEDVESKETADETVINIIICSRLELLKTREVKKTRTLKTSEWSLHMTLKFRSYHFQYQAAILITNNRKV